MRVGVIHDLVERSCSREDRPGFSEKLIAGRYLRQMQVCQCVHAVMRTISYGKERPVAVCNDISCWSQNRRAVTVLNASS